MIMGPFQITDAVSMGKSTRWLVATVLTILGAMSSTRAEMLSSEQQQQWLHAHGDIVVGTTAQGRGSYETWQQGKLKGLSIDYLDMLTNSLRAQYRIKSYANWHDLYLAVCTGQVDLVMTQFTPVAGAGLSCMSYTQPYFKAMPIVVTRRGSGVLDSADLHGLKLVMGNQSSLVEALATRYKGASISAFENVQEALEQVRDGGADAFVGSPQTVRALLDSPAFRQLHIIGSINTAVRSVAFGLAPGREPLREALNNALRALSPDQLRAASEDWNVKVETTAKVNTMLSSDEKHWLATLPTLRVGFALHEFPYAFFDNFGQPSGIAADFFEIIAQGLQVRFDFVPIESYETALARLRRGDLDLIAVSPDHQQDRFPANTKAYVEGPLVIAADYADGASELRDLSGTTVAVDEPPPPGLLIKLQRYGISSVPVANMASGLNRVRAGEVRAYIGDLFLLDPLIQSNYVGLIKIAGPVGARRGISIGIRTRYESLVPLVNRILSNLPSRREQRVASTWLAPQYTYGIPESVFWTQIMPLMVLFLASGGGFAAGYWRLRREIRRRIEIETQLETARDLAESQAQARSTFLAVMSHEIRTPLSGVIGMLELLARTSMRPQQQEMVNALDESAHTLLQILDSVLDYTKIDADQMELEWVPIDLRRLLANVVLLMGEPARRRGVGVSYQIDDNVSASPLGDPVRIRQILANLMGNAAKFTHRGEIRVTLSVVSETPDRQRLEFVVADSGIGIAPDVLQNLAVPFKQAESSTARKYGGTGLGLAVSLRLANLMGGTLTLNSEQGVGTVARFECEFEIGDTSKASASDDRCGVIFAQADRTPTAALKAHTVMQTRPHVLIVEDHHINRQMLARQMDSLGCDSTAVGDGVSALQALRQLDYDVVLTDWQLPVCDGIELAAKWRAIEHERVSGARLPIVVLSAASRPEQSTWLSAGIDAYLRKPVRLNVLSETLSHFLRNWAPPPLRLDVSEIGEAVQGIDMKTLSTVYGTPEAARRMLAESGFLLRQELNALQQHLSSMLEEQWTPKLHRILGALSTIGHWRVLEDGEAFESAIVRSDALDWLPDMLPLMQGLEHAIAEVEGAAEQGSSES